MHVRFIISPYLLQFLSNIWTFSTFDKWKVIVGLHQSVWSSLYIYIYIYNIYIFILLQKIYLYYKDITCLYGWYLSARLYRRVRVEAALRRMITVWHQSTARTIRMHRIRLLSYRSRGIWCHKVNILRSAASSRTRLLNSKRESRGVARPF